jgi:ABC-type bacteriocin/lantibiotic exporter with double-glycine peptidase domain
VRRSVLNIAVVLLCACAFVCAVEPAGMWLDVPFVKQEKNGCGAASIAMVIQFWQRQQGLPLTADSDGAQIQQSLYSSEAHGIYASALEHYFKQRGYQTFAFQGCEDDLRQHLAKGRPLIVALKTGGRAALHYVVVTGLDSEHNLVLLNDPAERKLLKRELASFAREWKGAGNWTLLAVPQPEGASSAR